MTNISLSGPGDSDYAGSPRNINTGDCTGCECDRDVLSESGVCTCHPQEPSGGTKHDSGKVRYDLLPPDVLKEVAKVLTLGANTYGDYNWAEGMSWHRVYRATLHHVFDFWEGKEIDEDTGLFVLANAICELMFLLAYYLRGVGEDDRPKPKQG